MGAIVYLFVFISVAFNLYLTEKYKCNSFFKQSILWFPAIVIYMLPLAFQDGVGKDYYAYYNSFYDGSHALYLKKQEYLYYYLQELVVYLGDPQLQFFFVGTIQTLLFFYILFLLKKYNYNATLIFCLFFLVTGMYHNQMNGMRQFIAIYFFVIFCLLSINKEYFKSILFFLIGLFFHKSIIIPLFYFFPILFFSKFYLNYRWLSIFSLFVGGGLLHMVNWTHFVQGFLNLLSLNYDHYLDSDYGSGRDIASLATKFYFIPLYIWFLIIFYKTKNSRNDILILCLWALTCFIYLQGIYFSLFIRTWAYFVFFSVFPLYFILKYYKGNVYVYLLIFIYLFVPYFLKISIFSIGEYTYSFYSKWF